MFEPGLEIGQVIKNADVVDIFKCGNMGGMRRSKTTNTLVLVSDYTKGVYYDKWIGGVLHYTGMGKSGDQSLTWSQNATLADCQQNGVDVHLFEVIDAGEYIYCGRIELVSPPYSEVQQGEDGVPRKVWMFPIRPTPENDVRKPEMFVFDDMEDYHLRGKNVDAQYVEWRASKKSRKQVVTPEIPKIKSIPAKPRGIIPHDIIGRKVTHQKFGRGTITKINGEVIDIQFETSGTKSLGYDWCMKQHLLEFE